MQQSQNASKVKLSLSLIHTLVLSPTDCMQRNAIKDGALEEAICNRGFEEEDEGERGKADTDGYGFW